MKLTRKEFDLLWRLASNAGRLVTKGAAPEHVRELVHREDSQNLRGFIRQPRARMGCDADNPRDIVTEPGVGHRFADG